MFLNHFLTSIEQGSWIKSCVLQGIVLWTSKTTSEKHERGAVAPQAPPPCFDYFERLADPLFLFLLRACLVMYGSRSKTHARPFSIRVESADMDLCFLLRPKAAKARQKVCEGFEYHCLHEILTRKHDHNSLSRFCWGGKGRKRVESAA